MTSVVPESMTQEEAWRRAEAETISVMGSLNAATARLVSTIAMLLDTDGWHGWGIRSVEHWVCWKAAVSRARAAGLVQIARRRDDLPACWALFEAGRIGEDAMVRIARRVPSERDGEVAGWVCDLLISQLQRALSCLPELRDADPDAAPAPQPERCLLRHARPDGWTSGSFCLPPDEAALLDTALTTARDAEFRDRAGLAPDAELAGVKGPRVSWVDAFVRLASEGTDALDTTLARTGHRGARHQVVLHYDIDPDGRFGPGQLHLGLHLPDPVARYLACDADVLVAATHAGRLLGITPTVRAPARPLRRYLERRDGGCAHPLCSQTRWLHAHHLQHWEHDGPTTPENLVSLCPAHHRQLHHGDYTIDGNPEGGTLEFRTPRGERIEPPDYGPPAPATPGPPNHYRQPYGLPLNHLGFAWN